MNSDLISVRPSSQIQRRELKGRFVFEKHYTCDDWGGTESVIRKRLSREIDLLERISRQAGFGKRLGVVRVAETDEQRVMISTVEVAGTTIAEWMSTKNARDSVLPWYLAGRWLRVFQSIPITEESRHPISSNDPSDLVEYCELRLDTLKSDFGYRWPNVALRQELLDRVARLQVQAASEYAPKSVWTHSDFAPGNLMWGNGILTPIDFAMAGAGNPLADAAYLIHRTEMARVYRPWIRLPVAAVARAIFRGLGQPEADQSATYELLTLKNLICRLHTYVRRRPRNRIQAIHDRWVRGVVRSRLTSLCKR
ncbi:MAG: phosphotransferase [Planctomycetaceae bacterium]|nr:phosphotransferase [Planctomycetaceae bacterium]